MKGALMACFAALVAGCFSPSPEGLLCSEGQRLCPPGYSCEPTGICTSNGDAEGSRTAQAVGIDTAAFDLVEVSDTAYLIAESDVALVAYTLQASGAGQIAPLNRTDVFAIPSEPRTLDAFEIYDDPAAVGIVRTAASCDGRCIEFVRAVLSASALGVNPPVRIEGIAPADAEVVRVTRARCETTGILWSDSSAQTNLTLVRDKQVMNGLCDAAGPGETTIGLPGSGSGGLVRGGDDFVVAIRSDGVSELRRIRIDGTLMTSLTMTTDLTRTDIVGLPTGPSATRFAVAGLASTSTGAMASVDGDFSPLEDAVSFDDGRPGATEGRHPRIAAGPATDERQELAVVWDAERSDGRRDVWMRTMCFQRLDGTFEFQGPATKLASAVRQVTSAPPRVVYANEGYVILWRDESAPGGLYYDVVPAMGCE